MDNFFGNVEKCKEKHKYENRLIRSLNKYFIKILFIIPRKYSTRNLQKS